jgi:hypothetical protein
MADRDAPRPNAAPRRLPEPASPDRPGRDTHTWPTIPLQSPGDHARIPNPPALRSSIPLCDLAAFANNSRSGIQQPPKRAHAVLQRAPPQPPLSEAPAAPHQDILRYARPAERTPASCRQSKSRGCIRFPHDDHQVDIAFLVRCPPTRTNRPRRWQPGRAQRPAVG